MLRAILIAALLSATPALAAVEGPVPAATPIAAAPQAAPEPATASAAPAAETVNAAPAAGEAQMTYDAPTAAPGDAPTSPTILDANGDVLVTGSVGASSRPVPPPARLCIAPHGACALPPVTGPGQVCECFTFGIGSEQGIAE